MGLETSVFTFKISVPFEQWAAVFDSKDVAELHVANGVKPLYRGISKDKSNEVIVIHQAEAGVAKTFFDANRELIEAGGHIWDSTKVSYWKAAS